jgi:hypothetical protein
MEAGIFFPTIASAAYNRPKRSQFILIIASLGDVRNVQQQAFAQDEWNEMGQLNICSRFNSQGIHPFSVMNLAASGTIIHSKRRSGHEVR